MRAGLLQRSADLRQDLLRAVEDIASLHQYDFESEGLEKLQPSAQTLACHGVTAMHFNDDRPHTANVLYNERADGYVTIELMRVN